MKTLIMNVVFNLGRVVLLVLYYATLGKRVAFCLRVADRLDALALKVFGKDWS